MTVSTLKKRAWPVTGQSLYSEVPNKRACSLSFFGKKIHQTFNFSCNKHKIPPYSFIDLLKAKTKLHDLKVAVGYPNETQSFFEFRV